MWKTSRIHRAFFTTKSYLWKTTDFSILKTVNQGINREPGRMSTVLWQSVLGEIELSVSQGNFATWFKPTTLESNNDGHVSIGVPNIFVKQQLEKRFNDQIVSALSSNGVVPKSIT